MAAKRGKTFWSHTLALVESNEVGAGTRIWPFSHIMAGAIVGKDCNIGEHVFVESGVVIGDGVTVKNGVALWEGVTIANHAFIGPYAVFTNDRRPRSPRLPVVRERYERRLWITQTVVGEGATIGANATILCGTRLGDFSMIAAGAVVTKDVPPFTLVKGVPARECGKVNREGQPLKKHGTLWVEPESGRRYRLDHRDLHELP